VIVFSKGEAEFAAAAIAAAGARARRAFSIETRGREGVTFMLGGETRIVPVEPVDTDDSTGAGDTFIGGFLAAWIKATDPELAIRAGVETARMLLSSRASAASQS
jgi:ribokinase